MDLLLKAVLTEQRIQDLNISTCNVILICNTPLYWLVLLTNPVFRYCVYKSAFLGGDETK